MTSALQTWVNETDFSHYVIIENCTKEDRFAFLSEIVESNDIDKLGTFLVELMVETWKDHILYSCDDKLDDLLRGCDDWVGFDTVSYKENIKTFLEEDYYQERYFDIDQGFKDLLEEIKILIIP